MVRGKGEKWIGVSVLNGSYDPPRPATVGGGKPCPEQEQTPSALYEEPEERKVARTTLKATLGPR